MMNELYPELSIASRKRKYAAYIIDLAVLIMIVSPVYMVIFDSSSSDGSSLFSSMSVFAIVTTLLIMLKDSYKGISPSRWIMGIKVVSFEDPEKTPSVLRLFARNLFNIFWPVEFIATLVVKNKRRIGDIALKTVVVDNLEKPGKLIRIITLIAMLSISLVVIFGSTLMTIKNSDAYAIAKTEVVNNQELKGYIGDITEFGAIPQGSIQFKDSYGIAQFSMFVVATEKDADITVTLQKEPEGEWILTNISLVEVYEKEVE